MRQTTRSQKDLSESYARVGLIRIARRRFLAFEAKFNRVPGPDEPLFFDESEDCPVKADAQAVRRQMATAARALGIRLGPILEFVGLVPHAVLRNERTVLAPRADTSNRPSMGVSRSAAPPPLNRLLADSRLRRRYGISKRELAMLSQAAFLGEINTPEDLVLIVREIRKRGS
jgi:hypothetical protein